MGSFYYFGILNVWSLHCDQLNMWSVFLNHPKFQQRGGGIFNWYLLRLLKEFLTFQLFGWKQWLVFQKHVKLKYDDVGNKFPIGEFSFYYSFSQLEHWQMMKSSAKKWKASAWWSCSVRLFCCLFAISYFIKIVFRYWVTRI